MNRSIRSWLGGALALLAANCSLRFENPRPSELIIFTSIGVRPFQDYVYTVWPDGSHLEQFLAPSSNRSYQSAAGNSLRSKLVVSVYEANREGIFESHLYVYHPALNHLQLIGSSATGSEGSGIVSPDDAKAVFTFMPAVQTGQQAKLPELWIVDLGTGERKKLTSALDSDPNTWYAAPSWRPDGKEIVSLQLRRTPEGIVSNLVRVAAEGGESTVFLEPPIVDARYSPDGTRLAVVAESGLTVFGIPQLNSQVIVPWDTMPDYTYQAGTGLGWSASQDKIAFSFLNKKTNRVEIWTVSSNGTTLKRIYEHKEGKIVSLSFIKN